MQTLLIRPPPIVTDLDSDGDQDMLILTNDNHLKHFTFPTTSNVFKPQETVKGIGNVVSQGVVIESTEGSLSPMLIFVKNLSIHLYSTKYQSISVANLLPMYI